MPKYYCDYCDTFLTHDSVIKFIYKFIHKKCNSSPLSERRIMPDENTKIMWEHIIKNGSKNRLKIYLTNQVRKNIQVLPQNRWWIWYLGRPVPGMHPGMIHGVGGFGNAIAPTQGLAGRPSKFSIELISIFFSRFFILTLDTVRQVAVALRHPPL